MAKTIGRSRQSWARRSAARPRSNPALTRRTQVVWLALVASMTLVGGGLWLAGGGTLANAQSLTPMLATSVAGSSGFDALLRMPAPIEGRRWQAIVIHHSGEPVGTPATLDSKARAMGLKGLGYHFLVGNGGGMADGEISVGERWQHQLAGAHTAGPDADWFNRHSIGICLVGDGDATRFTPQQTRRLCQLVEFLSKRLGIPPDRVYLHNQLCPTTSPGRLFPESTLRSHMQGS